MQGKKTYQEKFFVNFRLSARVPAENFYRRLKESLDLDYLRALTSKYYGKEGHKNIDEPLPWHSAISRTRQLFGEEVFLSFFRDILRQCAELGLVCGRTQAVDSAFIKANASSGSISEKFRAVPLRMRQSLQMLQIRLQQPPLQPNRPGRPHVLQAQQAHVP